MRIATFNILHGRPVSGPSAHRDAFNDPPDNSSQGADSTAPLRQSIEQLDCDVIGLQEVDVAQPRSDNADQPAVVAAAMSAQWSRFVPTVIGTPGASHGFRSSTPEEQRADAEPVDRRYGVALVSRLPVVEWHTHVFAPAPMSMPLMVQTDGKPKFLRVRDEQRAAIAATIEGRNGLVTIATAHLSFVPGFNVSQLRKLRIWLDELPRPLVLMGDFNLPWPLPKRITKWSAIAHTPTFPSYKPRVQFDHILVDGASAGTVARAKAQTEALHLPVSDHCALRSQIDL